MLGATEGIELYMFVPPKKCQVCHGRTSVLETPDETNNLLFIRIQKAKITRVPQYCTTAERTAPCNLDYL